MPRPASLSRLVLMPSPDIFAPPGPAPFVPQTQSIDFDGVTEKLETGATSLGFADTVSIAGWFKVTNTLSRQDTLWTFEGAPSGSNFRLFQRSNVGPAPSCQVFNATTNTTWTALPLTAATWHHYCWIWDTQAFMHLWIDGVDQGILATGVEVMADSGARTIAVAEASTGVANMLGRAASLAFWNTRLGDLEVPAIYNAGSINFDLNTDQGNYASAASLIHWFEIGKLPSPNIGIDSAASPSPSGLDLIAAAVGITDADRVVDVP